MSNAIMRIEGLPDRPLRNIEEVARTFAAIQDRVNLLTPVIRADYIPDMHQISLRVVMLDSTVQPDAKNPQTIRGKHCYFDSKFCAKDELAIGKQGLLLLADAGGLSIVGSHRADDKSDPDLCEWYVEGEVLQLDGNRIRKPASKTVDLAQEKTHGWSAARIAMAREHMESAAEAKALTKLIRMVYSLQQKYSIADLQKPFVVPVLVPFLDCSDPEIKRMVAAKALGMDLYPPRQAIAAPAVHQTEVVDTATGEVYEVADDPSDFPEIPPPAPVQTAASVESASPKFFCECPCEHGGTPKEVSPQVAAMTRKQCGAIRCGPCFPGPKFHYESHRDLATLGLPKNPGYTPHQANQIAGTRQGGGGR